MKSAALAPPRPETLLNDLVELTKARLSLLVLVTTLVGFLAGWRGPMDYLLLAATLAARPCVPPEPVRSINGGNATLTPA